MKLSNEFDGLKSGDYNTETAYNYGEITIGVKAVVVVESGEKMNEFERELNSLLKRYAI